jgi:hypothetical protein
MGGVVNSLFGSGGQNIKGTEPGKNIGMFPSSQYYINKNLNFDTGFSNLNPKTGQINIDPTGRNLNLGALGQYSQNLGQTRESLLGNQGAFMNARVNPLIESLAMGRGALQRDTARTGVRGTFRDQALQNYDIQGNRALADQRALATNDTLNALNVLDQSLFNAGTGVGTNLFNQELAALGLSANTIQALKSIASNLTTGSASTAAQASSAAAQADQARQDNILGALGGLFTGLGWGA